MTDGPTLLEEVFACDMLCGGVYQTWGDQVRFVAVEGLGDGIENYTLQECRAFAEGDGDDRPAWIAAHEAMLRHAQPPAGVLA